MKRETSALPQMPQLDALRAFAVIAVMIYHGLHMHYLEWAVEGVMLFFVLSGYLITSILLRSRDAGEAIGCSRGSTLRNFYFRRALRIFPLYYFLIIIGLILNLEPVREGLAWFLTYSINLYTLHLGWYTENYAHFWTLAVEEQFYLVWPWVILFAPRKWLVPVTIAFVSIGPLFRWYGVAHDWKGMMYYIATPACLDTLGMGALLAVLTHFTSPQTMRKVLRRFALPVGLVACVVLLAVQSHEVYWKASSVLYQTALAIFYCWLVAAAGRGFGGIAGRILTATPLTYVGKISYGIYVYHEFMPKTCEWIAKALNWTYPENAVGTFIIPTIATLLVASLSWYVMEKPINNLKRYFDPRGLVRIPVEEVAASRRN